MFLCNECTRASAFRAKKRMNKRRRFAYESRAYAHVYVCVERRLKVPNCSSMMASLSLVTTHRIRVIRFFCANYTAEAMNDKNMEKHLDTSLLFERYRCDKNPIRRVSSEFITVYL